MSLEVAFRESCASLTSSRATERKKSAETIKDFLIRNAVPSLLSENTLTKKGFTWNDLFEDINEYIIKETEKYETSKSFDNVTVPLCTSLLHLCVAGSNKGQAYIKCDLITKAYLNVLSDSRMSKAIGDAYINLLYKHVLPYDYYLGFITSDTWTDLLDVTITASLSNNSKLDDYTKLRLLWFIMKNGLNYCQFVMPLRDSLPKLNKYFLKVISDKKVQEVLTEIVTLLLETLSTECRLTMCEFFESILTSILKFYDPIIDQKKKSALFKLLYLLVTLHHPEGKSQHENGSLASDWELWNRHLHSILEIICLEANILQKNRKPTGNIKQCMYYYSLAASVYFQIFKSSSHVEDETAEGSFSKRQKVTYNKNKGFGDLIEELKQNHVPWLGIIHMYIKSFGFSTSPADDLSLMTVLESLLSTQHNINWDVFEELTCLVVKKMQASKGEFNYDNMFTTLWNSCVRNSTQVNTAHKALHKIVQLLMSLNFLKYQNVQPLLKLYFEKGMPVTTSSVTTLNCILNNFFSKCSYMETRINCFIWSMQEQITTVEVPVAKELLLRLSANENVNCIEKSDSSTEYEVLYDILYNSMSKSLLFGEFELDVHNLTYNQKESPGQIEINDDLHKYIHDYLDSSLLQNIEKLKTKDLDLTTFLNYTSLILAYIDILLKNNFISRESIANLQIYPRLKEALRLGITAVTNTLKSNTHIPRKLVLIQHMKNLLVTEYNSLLNSDLRLCFDDGFFHCINSILHSEDSNDDEEVVYEGDDTDTIINVSCLKRSCIDLLAAYCRKRANYRQELLQLILDPKLYNFSSSKDVDCALGCIEVFNDLRSDDPPLDLTFALMQYMCKDLFRNPKATFGILKMLLRMFNRIWSHNENMKRNCIIMIKGYLMRCKNLFYPPNVAALIYECVAKIAALDQEEYGETFKETLIERMKGDIHILRIYCCYLLKLLTINLTEIDVEIHLSSLLDIYLINVSERNEYILKDESANRTLSVLHNFSALIQIRKSLIHKIVLKVLEIQKEKSLDVLLVKKVLDKMIKQVTTKSADVYLNNNILSILQFWFSKNYELKDLPLCLFGFDNFNGFIDRHMQWLMPADALWRRQGNIGNSDVLIQIKEKLGKSEGHIIEMCFCNIIILCLPYIVNEKYKLEYLGTETQRSFNQSMNNANTMFQLTRQILDSEKWSNLFVENMGELILLTVMNLRDYSEAEIQFQMSIPGQPGSFYYSKTVFCAILKYFGALIDGDIMQYVCENQPLIIFKIIFILQENILTENVLEFKVLLLHSLVTFVENIPLNNLSDAFLCNYICISLAHAIKASHVKEEIKVLTEALRKILFRFLPDKANLLRNSVSKVLSIVMIKKDEYFEQECGPLLDFLTVDMKYALKENEDEVDFIQNLSQAAVENMSCLTENEFTEKLKKYIHGLSCPSHEALTTMHKFIRANKHYVNNLCNSLNSKGFSDDCGTSAIHQIIYILSTILKSTSDEKTKIEACNCLSTIGTYDLKTLVTVPPVHTTKIVDVQPKKYLAIVLLTSLSEILFDEDPSVTTKVTKTLSRLLKYREGKDALELADVNKDIIKPFSSLDCNATTEFKIDRKKFDSKFKKHSWIPNGKEDHHQWIIRTTTAVLDVFTFTANYLNTLQSVCSLKPTVCRKILPALFGLLLHYASEDQIRMIGEQLDQFFNYVWEGSFDEKVEISGDSTGHKKTSSTVDQDHKNIVQYVLDIVDFVRLQRNHYKARPDRVIETLNYLKLEYDRVAWAATVADQNLAAIYYGELWVVAQNDGIPTSTPEATTLLDGGENIQRIFRKCFVSIGEMDAIDGCGTAHLTIEDEKRKHLINTAQYTDALLLHDIALSCGGRASSDLQYGVVKSLHKSGMHHLALQYIKSLPENDEINDIKYECLSFLGDWNEFLDTRDLEEKSKQSNYNPQFIIKAFRYACLKDCINLQTTSEFENKLILPLNRAKLAVSKLSETLNMENCQSVYNVVGKLHLFNDIEDYYSVRCDKLSVQELLNQWQVEKLPAFNDFKHLEGMITQRSLILEHAAKNYDNYLNDIVALQLQYTELGLENHRIQMAQRLLATVKQLQLSDQVALVEGRISWAKGHKDIALSLLHNIVSKKSSDVNLTAMTLRQYGMWMAESKCDNTRDIIDKYLKKSLEVLNKHDHTETRLKVYYDIAKFADAEYKKVVAYMNSSIFENKVKCLENMKGTASCLKSTQQTLSRDERKALFTNERFRDLDEAEIASTKAEKESFLQMAMRYYLLSLKQCEENNLSVFRVISLWLDNPSLELDDAGNTTFEDLLHAIPSRKFITVLPQLAPHLSTEESPFADNLRKIIKKCAIEHPHHTLPILFSLKNSDKDKYILNASKTSGGSQNRRTMEPREAASHAIITELAKNKKVAAIISQMDKLCDATISFANFVPKTKEVKQKIPAAEQINKLGNLDAIPVPTVTIPVRADCNYKYISTLTSFENYFELVGGINCPKKIYCRSSNGKISIILIKGQDDLRQDAVMQQVFTIVNTLLEKNPITNRNKLLIRTYKVVPMSRRSGVLEWCEGTIPLGGYLVGSGNTGAHARYRPRDITCGAARQKLAHSHETRKSNKEKLAIFLKILKEFKPVFHYFFTEHYLDPVTWYERRLAYTKSVASSSMVGYILGLGDRHVQNILIDKKTAEVIHIDFGIAFDQGKALPTPETVPFRLTQDIVAGFGSSGVEGIFRKSCEKTMQLLRDNQETLLTILEVLLCDPLYSWTVTTQQNATSRDTSMQGVSGSHGSLAQRALLTVSSKLSGMEGGVAGGVAVQGQVARLINAATDPANLCRLFQGWQPYL